MPNLWIKYITPLNQVRFIRFLSDHELFQGRRHLKLHFNGKPVLAIPRHKFGGIINRLPEPKNDFVAAIDQTAEQFHNLGETINNLL